MQPLAIRLLYVALIAFFASLGLFLSSATVSYASPSASDEVPFCLPFAYERAHGSTYVAGKRTDLDVGEPRTVRMIYFLPNGRPFRAAVIDSMKATIGQVQTFYDEQMQAHGHGDATFRFETDAEGEPLVHHVEGEHSASHYYEDAYYNVIKEVEQAFDVRENIYFIVIDNGLNRIGGVDTEGQRMLGVGDRKRNGGYVIVPSEVPSERPSKFRWILAAHELGHAFGLEHDFRDDAYIMSYGIISSGKELSMCSAEFLAVHPYFNPNATETQPPTVELISPETYPTNAKSVQIQLKVSDSEGLHQVILLADFFVKACRSLEGEKETVVTFDYDGVIPSVLGSSLSDPIVHWLSVYVVDTGGSVNNSPYNAFTLSAVSSSIATLVDDALTDFPLFANAFGSSDFRFDLDANGTVDFADFFLFAEAADESERDQLFALAKELIGLPENAQLYQNAPNPFNSQTVFSYFLLTPGPMRLEVFTLSGQRVAILSTGPQQAGRHRLAWDGRDSEGRPLASGVYLYRLVAAEGVLTRKLILLR